MKKIIKSLTAMGIVMAVSATASCASYRETNLYIDSLDGLNQLQLGKYNVSEYSKSKVNNCNEYISFTVKSGKAFYDDVIKKSDTYDSALEYSVDGYFSYGFLNDSGHTYLYTIKDNKVKISENSAEYTNDTATSNFEDYQTLVAYYINLPLQSPLYYTKLDENSSYYQGKSSESWEYEYYTTLTDSNMDYAMVSSIVRCLDESMYLFTDDFIAVKGLCCNYEGTEASYSVSPDYLILLREEDGKVRVFNYGD